MANADIDKLWRRARHYIDANQAAPARAVLESIVMRDPADARAHLFLSGVHGSQDRPRAAARQVREAAAVAPDDPGLLQDIARAAVRAGEVVIARELLDRSVVADATPPALLLSAALCWQLLGDNGAALAAIERARRTGAHGNPFHFYRGVQLGFHGDLAGAEAELERCVALDPPIGHAFVQLAAIRPQTPQKNHLAAIERALARVAPDGDDAAVLQFARYKELEDLGRHDEAWHALAHANALVRARSPFDAAREAATFDRLLEACTPEFLDTTAAVPTAGPQPIFIIGMPRSGTTVLERILGNHSQVESAGELAAFGQALAVAIDHWLVGLLPDAILLDRLDQVDWAEVGQRYFAQSQWRARGKKFYVDKLPRNWMLAGLIHKALPQARILNLVRDPMDVCFSNWRACLGDGPEYAWAYDLDALAAHHRQYRRVLAHWRRVMPGVILDVDYARLVHDPEAVVREALAFCGLAYEPGCADLARNTTPSATLSMSQIRQPVHARSSRAWAPHADRLSGLAAALAADADA